MLNYYSVFMYNYSIYSLERCETRMAAVIGFAAVRAAFGEKNRG